VVILNGRKRNSVKWIPSKGHIKAVVVIAHGLHEHALRYCDIAHALTAKGYAVFALDFEGHGHSGDIHGLISDSNKLCEDLAVFANAVHTQFPTLPLYMLGHSMGVSAIIVAAEKVPSLKVRNWYLSLCIAFKTRT
jgi:alpha-beta hydrolase superfamily lysophospholipase